MPTLNVIQFVPLQSLQTLTPLIAHLARLKGGSLQRLKSETGAILQKISIQGTSIQRLILSNNSMFLP